MALGQVSCPAEVDCTTILALRNDKFSRLGLNGNLGIEKDLLLTVL